MVQMLRTDVNPDTEIRKLGGRLINGLTRLLEQNKDWEKLMSEVRKDCFDLNHEEYKYTDQDIKTIAAASIEYHRTCTEIFLDEWGTSGRKRPTVQLLYDYLNKVELRRAADYIGTTFLNLPEIEQPLPEFIGAVDVDDVVVTVPEPESVERSRSIDGSHHQRSTVKCGEYILSNIEEHDEIGSERLATVVHNATADPDQSVNPELLSKFDLKINDSIERIPYEVLKTATRNFEESRILGKGAFGSVYLGKLNDVNRAIKVLKTCAVEHFERELTILSGGISHRRLLSPVAVSVDEVPSLIYPYMSHGSLEDRLALKFEELLPLGWQKRIMIAGNIIEGLRYLHTRPQPIVHRDIKSSNILLDGADVAQIGDFGLIREKKESLTSYLETVEGTDAYMAPEAYRFQSSTKLDVYSYGMVLLELLTGLPIIHDEKGHLRDYVEEELEDGNDEIMRLLDEKAGKWPREIACELYLIANDCLELDSKERCDSVNAEKAVNNLIGKMVTR